MPFSKKTRVLIIDDDEDDYFITSEYLKSIPGKTFIIDWCYKYSEALKVIEQAQYDVYLVDYRLGAKTGIDLIKEALAFKTEKPFILLTGKGDLEIDVEAMKLGAFDYIIKSDLSSEKLERSIRYSLDRATTLKEVRTKEKKYRDLFDKSGDAIFVTNHEFYFTEINNAFRELIVCDESFISHSKLIDLLSNEYQCDFIKNTLTEVGSIDDFEAQVKDCKGHDHQCILSASKQRNLNGEIYFQGIFHDITLIRKAEKATLQEEKLAATGRLVRTLAHEVRNPINNINLAAEQLKTIEMNEEQQLYVDIIHRNSNRINELIKELLNTSKPAEINLSAKSFNVLLNKVIGFAQDRIKLKNIDLTLQLPAEEIIIVCDASKIEIALLNILINAVEAIEKDTGKILISGVKEQQEFILKISDNGCGITNEHLPRLFEPYFTSKRNGIGLGLAASFNIIQAHNGRIEVESIVNEGTTFIITFSL